ncbi:MAG: hypothetical protein RQ826_17400 [Xanthomonadales bacterium]|nr:hypothetical protein [Xanthomonadales bacterium]
MTIARTLDALLDSYHEFDMGELQRNYYQDKTSEFIKRPVARYSYAMVRATLNVFVQHNFANHLNSLAFDRENFYDNVRHYVPNVWSFYLEEAQATLPSAKLSQLCDLEFGNWGPAGSSCFGAWHRLTFPEFRVNVLLQIANDKGRLGAFEGFCFLDNDQQGQYRLPDGHEDTCQHLGSLHLQMIIDEILEALGIAPESVISAIKYLMR